MPDRAVLVVSVTEDVVGLRQTMSVLDSHGIRHTSTLGTRSALKAAALEPPLLAIVHGDKVGMALVCAVEELVDLTGHRVPIMVLAEDLTEPGEQRLLTSGARDVLGTPVSPTRLRARVLAMRRAAIGDAEAAHRLVCGELVIDVRRREVSIGGREVQLTRSEFNLLVTLAREPRRVVTRVELASCIGEASGGRAVESHLSRLRKKITAMRGSRLIEPVRGVGYRLGVAYSEQQVG